MKFTTCKSCKAAIAFVRLPSGRRLPINPDPTDNGNVHITGSRNEDEPAARVISTQTGTLFDNAPTTTAYTSHFATCPQASQHRRSR